MKKKYGFQAGRWEALEVWLEDGCVYYASLEDFAIIFRYDIRGWKGWEKPGYVFDPSVHFSVEVLL